MRRALLLLAVGLTLIGVTDTAAARSGSAATTITTHPQNSASPHSRGAMSGAPSAPPSTIAAPDGYRTVVDDTGVVSVAIPVDWIAETTPRLRYTPEGHRYAPGIAAGREAAPPPSCDGCGTSIPAPEFSIVVSPYEPISPEAPPECDALEVIPFDSRGFTGRREIGGGCDADIERIVASKPGAITVDVHLTYSTSDQGPQTEEDRAAVAAVFETALATFEWTGRPYDEVAVGLPSVTTTSGAPVPTSPTDEPTTTEVGAFACPSPDVLSQALGTPLTPDPTGSEPCRFALDVNGHAFIIVLSYAAEPDLEGCFMPYQPGPLGEFQDLCGTAHAQVVQAWNRWGSGWLYLSLESDAFGSIDDHVAVGTAVLQALGVVPGAAGTPEAPTGPPASTAAPSAPTVPAPAAPPTVSTLCVLADIDFAAVRSAPGTGNPEVGRIPPGTCGLVAVASDHSTGEEWLHVQYDGIDGWSAARLYVPDANAPSPTTVPGAPVSTGLWTFDGDWLDAVPQLGTEPVRGSGCGADGSIGDVIPDGWWFGAVTSSDDTQIGFTVGCAYYGESALPYLEECGEDCQWVESFMPRFYTDRVWLVPTDDGIVKELTSMACADSAAALEAQFIGGLNLLSWIHVTEGQVDYVRYACPGG